MHYVSNINLLIKANAPVLVHHMPLFKGRAPAGTEYVWVSPQMGQVGPPKGLHSFLDSILSSVWCLVSVASCELPPVMRAVAGGIAWWFAASSYSNMFSCVYTLYNTWSFKKRELQAFNTCCLSSPNHPSLHVNSSVKICIQRWFSCSNKRIEQYVIT